MQWLPSELSIGLRTILSHACGRCAVGGHSAAGYATTAQSASPRGNAAEDQRRNVAESLRYCVRIVEERDYENYLSATLMPKRVQPAIITILAINAEIASLRQKIQRHSGLSDINQLQFWKETLNVWAGRQRGLLPRQPVAACLCAFGHPADVDLLVQLVAARQSTLGDRPFKCVADLEENARLVYGSLARLWAAALRRADVDGGGGVGGGVGAQTEEAAFLAAADATAKALGVAVLLRSTLPLLQKGVVLWPEDVMRRYELSPEVIGRNRNPEALRRAAEGLCQLSAEHLREARAHCDKVSRPLRRVLVSSAFRAESICQTLRSTKFQLFTARLQARHPFTAWKIWWRHRRNVY